VILMLIFCRAWLCTEVLNAFVHSLTYICFL